MGQNLATLSLLWLYTNIISLNRRPVVSYPLKARGNNILRNVMNVWAMRELRLGQKYHLALMTIFHYLKQRGIQVILANCYAAKAAENNEYGAIDYLIKDERALDYLTSPAVMFEAANKMWKRDKNDGHNDRINGFIWFEKSAKAGYSLAQNQMGYIYLKGITVEPDTLKAVSWYKLAAKNNEAEAISALGRLYINGKGVDKDAEHGFQLLNESADKGHLNSKLYLAYCYLYGLGTNRNTQHARILFQKYFDNFNHEPEQRVIVVDNRVIDLDYLIGLTYYFENSPKCIPLFEASMQSKTFDRLQRGDLLRKLAFCYSDGKCGKHVDKATSDRLLSDAVNYGHFEITANNIIISFL